MSFGLLSNGIVEASERPMTDKRRIQQRCRHGEFLRADRAVDDRKPAVIELAAGPWPVFDIAASVICYPFDYSDEERTDLAALAQPHYPDPPARPADWARGFVRSQGTDTLALLKDLGAGVAAAISYQSRDQEGTQSPVQTLGRGWGSCLDIAVLFAEAARTLGFGARLISGYLYNPDRPLAAATSEGGSTPAWAEIFLPGLYHL